MSEQLYASFARKPRSLDEVKIIAALPTNLPCHIHIVETKALTADEYDEFTSDFFASRDWLAGKGGTYNHEGRKVVEVTAPDRISLYIDPSGYDYARYVGIRQ